MRYGQSSLSAAVLGAIIALAGLSAAAAQTSITDADRRAVAEMALQWAVAGGISDFKLVKDPSTLIVADANLPKNTQLTLSGHKVEMLSLLRIQARADLDGTDFLYFRFGKFTVKDGRVSVPIALVWAIAAKSTTQYLSGGGATLEFEKHDDKWQLLPVTNRWMS